MEQIILNGIDKKKNKIIYHYEISEGLNKYFSAGNFIIEYDENIEILPTSILAIPFVANVLPIIWLTDSGLVLDELDEDFYNCLPEVKKGYETMFPESEFLGKISVGKIVKNINSGENCAMLYSGGLDSAQTLISHYKEKPDLISIWGADIIYDNDHGWNIIDKELKIGAEQFGLNHIVIKSMFRQFDNEWVLDRAFNKQLKDGWWHGVKHGIAILSHISVLSYLKGYNRVYIAASHYSKSLNVRCASNPLTDNHVRFCGCQVFHDGFEFSRQDKVHNIIQFVKNTKIPLTLHVCWRSQSGHNCCHCEKCYRTIFGFLAENENPTKYGFLDFEKSIRNFDIFWLKSVLQKSFNFQQAWTLIAKKAKVNQKALKHSEYWKQIRSIKNFDYTKPKTFNITLYQRTKRKLGTMLFKIKRKLKIIKE